LTALGSAVLGAAMVAGVGVAIAKYGPGVAEKGTAPRRGTPGDWLGIDPTESRKDRLDRLNNEGAPRWKRFLLGDAAEPGFSFRDSMSMNTGIGRKDSGPADVSLVGVPEISIPGPVMTQPNGTQDVRITNPQPAPVFNVTINAPTNDPKAIADAAVSALSAKWNALSNGAFSDGGN
jgi:hypothetical protein